MVQCSMWWGVVALEKISVCDITFTLKINVLTPYSLHLWASVNWSPRSRSWETGELALATVLCLQIVHSVVPEEMQRNAIIWRLKRVGRKSLKHQAAPLVQVHLIQFHDSSFFSVCWQTLTYCPHVKGDIVFMWKVMLCCFLVGSFHFPDGC